MDEISEGRGADGAAAGETVSLLKIKRPAIGDRVIVVRGADSGCEPGIVVDLSVDKFGELSDMVKVNTQWGHLWGRVYAWADGPEFDEIAARSKEVAARHTQPNP